MQVGNVVKSIKGHDAQRLYLVIAVLNADFVLLCDGKYRKLDNPKQKRVKHVELLSEETFTDVKLDSEVRAVLKRKE